MMMLTDKEREGFCDSKAAAALERETKGALSRSQFNLEEMRQQDMGYLGKGTASANARGTITCTVPKGSEIQGHRGLTSHARN